MPISKVTASAALSKSQFEKELRRWLDESRDERIGAVDGYKGAPWIWVKHGSGLYHLNADTRRRGVSDYLELTEAEPDLKWIVTAGRAGKMTKVMFGKRMVAIPGFYFYRRA